jgi:caffeoyl-CoA O-methyltransferase
MEDYIRSLIPQDDTLLKEMESYAAENHVPIMQPEVVKFLTFLIKTKGIKRILEIGTAIGYSAIVMHKAAGTSKIVTIERNSVMSDRASKYIEIAGYSGDIDIIKGEAEDILKNLNEKFDLILLDAAKGQYLEFFSDCHRLLDMGGIIFADNVLFRGMVASDMLVIRRKITIVKRLRRYLEFISSNKDYETTIIPLGDGVSVSCRIGG